MAGDGFGDGCGGALFWGVRGRIKGPKDLRAGASWCEKFVLAVFVGLRTF